MQQLIWLYASPPEDEHDCFVDVPYARTVWHPVTKPQADFYLFSSSLAIEALFAQYPEVSLPVSYVVGPETEKTLCQRFPKSRVCRSDKAGAQDMLNAVKQVGQQGLGLWYVGLSQRKLSKMPDQLNIVLSCIYHLEFLPSSNVALADQLLLARSIGQLQVMKSWSVRQPRWLQRPMVVVSEYIAKVALAMGWQKVYICPMLGRAKIASWCIENGVMA